MTEFTASGVTDGDTFMIEEGWRWSQRSGDTLRAAGHNTPKRKSQGRKIWCRLQI